MPEIRSDTGLSAAAAGLLTTLPVLCFGLASLAAPALGRRFGIERTLLAGMVVLALGIALRSVPGTALVFLGTVVLGLAIAAANVLLPALTKRDFPARLGRMTALYASMLGGAAAIGSGVAVPVAEGSLGWRGALAAWAAPACVALLVWLPQARRHTEPLEAPAGARELRALWRAPLAWQVTLFFGLQSFSFFIVVTWLPELLVDRGLDASRAGLMLAVSQVSGVASTLVFPPLADRTHSQRGLVGAMCVLAVAGSAGLLLADTSAIALWVVLLGLGQGAGLALSLMFFVLRTRDARAASELSGMAQACGYTLAAAGPVAAGLLHDAAGAWEPVLLMLVAVSAIQFVVGLRAGRGLQLGPA